MIFRKTPPSASDINFLKRSIPGIQDISPETSLDRLNPQQVARLKELRTLVSRYGHKKTVEGKFPFTLELLKSLHEFVDAEKNLVQRVAYKNLLKKIRDDLMNLAILQKEVDELKKANSSEPVLERAHDALENLGQSILQEVYGLTDRLQNGVLQQTGLAASSLYRASLASERLMYDKLDKQGKRMLRRWNDVRLEVINLIGTTNHDAQAKRNLNRMQDDLDELLRYLDEYALLPWIAPRDVVAAISTLDRRLENYQDEYNLAQPDADRIANVITDRETRDDNRQKIAERVQKTLDSLGVTKNVSVGGAVRLVRGTIRAVSKTGMFLTRTLPNVVRSVATSVSTAPKRIVQTFRQVANMLGGTGRALFGLRKRGGSLDVKFEERRRGRETLGLNSTIERGYDRASPSMPVPTTGGFVPQTVTGIDDDFQPTLDPSLRSSSRPTRPSRAEESDSLPPDLADVWRDSVDATSRTPGTTQTGESGGGGLGLRSFIEDQFVRVNNRLDTITEALVGFGSRAGSDTPGEAEALRRDTELDLLKAIGASLSKIAGKVSAAGGVAAESSFLARILGKASMVKGALGSVLQVLGGWKVVTSSIGIVKKLAGGVLRMAGPLLRLGSFVGRVLAGPVGMVLGASLAGWNIGSALYEKYSLQIADLIDGGVEQIKGAINFVANLWNKGKEVVGKVRAPFKESAQRDIDNEMQKKGAIHKVTRDRAEALGIDTSSYPVYNPKDGSTSQPTNPVAPTTSVGPVQSTPSSSTGALSTAVVAPTLKSSSTTSAGPASKSGVGMTTPVQSSPTSLASPVSPTGPQQAKPATAVSTSPRATSTSSLSSPTPGGSSYGIPPASGGAGTYSIAAGSNLDKMQPGVMSNFNAMVAEYQSMGGKKKVSVNRGFATQEQQAEIFKKYGPGRAAPPGRSAHEHGIAIDIDRGAAEEMASMGLLAKYGFERPVRGEPWHLQVAGVTAAMAKNGIFSADKPTSQGGGEQTMQGKQTAPQAAPPLSTSSAAKAGTGEISTSMETNTGLPPEKAAYEPKPPVTNPATQGNGKSAGALPRNAAMPSGHGTSRIPEFSYSDPTFFALNLGALAA